MPKLQKKYASRDAALKAFEALLIDAEEGEEVTLHEDVIKQFEVVNDTTGSLKAARKAEKEAQAAFKALKDSLEGHEIEDLDEALEQLADLRAREAEFESGSDKDSAEIKAEARQLQADLRKATKEVAKMQKALEEKDAAFGSTRSELHELKFDSHFGKLAKEAGVKNSLDDLMDAARYRFKFDENGEIVNKKDDGPSMDEWLDERVSGNPIYTADLSNGGSNVINGGGGGGKRTIKREDYEKISTSDPAQASALMASVRKGEATLVD